MNGIEAFTDVYEWIEGERSQAGYDGGGNIDNPIYSASYMNEMLLQFYQMVEDLETAYITKNVNYELKGTLSFVN